MTSSTPLGEKPGASLTKTGVFDTARKAVVTSEGEVIKAKVRIGKK